MFLHMNIRTFVTILSRKAQCYFLKMMGGGRPFGTFPKIHPIWKRAPSLNHRGGGQRVLGGGEGVPGDWDWKGREGCGVLGRGGRLLLHWEGEGVLGRGRGRPGSQSLGSLRRRWRTSGGDYL